MDILKTLVSHTLGIVAIGLVLANLAMLVKELILDTLDNNTLGELVSRLQGGDIVNSSPTTKVLNYTKGVGLLCQWEDYLDNHYKVEVDVSRLYTSWVEYESYAEEKGVSTVKADELLTILVQDLFKLTENLDDYYSSAVLEKEIIETYEMTSDMFTEKLQELKDAMQSQETESKQDLKNKYEQSLVEFEKSIQMLIKRMG